LNPESLKQSVDETILTNWLTDSGLAFRTMFNAYYTEVCRHIFRYVPRQQATEDIAQEIFAELWSKREQIDIKTSVGAYLHRMAVTRALNYIRDNKKHLHLADEPLMKEPSGLSRQDDLLTADEMRQVIRKVIDGLPDRCQEVFLLSRNETMSYKEIADTMDISVKTVENQMIKALKQLREAIAQYRSGSIGDGGADSVL